MNKPELARRLAWSIAALSLTLTFAGFTINMLAQIQSHREGWLDLHQLFSPTTAVSYAVIGALVAARQPRNPIGWIFSAEGMLTSLVSLSSGYQVLGQLREAPLPGIDIARWLDLWVWIPVTLLPLTFVLLLFPDGRLPSRRWWPVAWSAGLGLAAYIISIALHPRPPVEANPPVNPFGIPGAVGVLELLAGSTSVLIPVGGFGAMAALVVRFRRSRGIEREQLKWLTYGGVISILGLTAMSAWSSLRPDDQLAYELMLGGTWVALATIVLAAGVAILRYRLYDIDLIINRTLVYSFLTLTLGLLYIGCILLIRTLVAPLTGGSELAIVASTLVIAALFNPLRKRIQNLIDRRFYRRKYDAAKVLAAFGTTARDETDLERLSAAMLQVVDETVQPEFVRLWLNEPATQSSGDGIRTDAASPQ